MSEDIHMDLTFEPIDEDDLLYAKSVDRQSGYPGYVVSPPPRTLGSTPQDTEDRTTVPPFPDAWRCRTCRWWNRQDGETYGLCRDVNAPDEDCSGPPSRAEAPKGILRTPSDWGCVRWEGRE